MLNIYLCVHKILNSLFFKILRALEKKVIKAFKLSRSCTWTGSFGLEWPIAHVVRCPCCLLLGCSRTEMVAINV